MEASSGCSEETQHDSVWRLLYSSRWLGLPSVGCWMMGGGDALEPAMFLYTYDELVGLRYWFVHVGFWYRLV